MERTKAVLAMITLIASFIILGALLFIPIPEANKDLFNIALGMIIGTGFGSVITYFFGSSDQELIRNKSKIKNKKVS